MSIRQSTFSIKVKRMSDFAFNSFFLPLLLHKVVKRSEPMRFSEIQKKEVIDGTKGSFLGYVQDATIDVKKGMLESLHISGGERSIFFDTKKGEIQKIRLQDITIIGKDIVLVGKKGKTE